MIEYLKIYSIIFTLSLLSTHGLGAQERIPEVEKLLGKMTLQEKIGQLNLLTPGGGVATGSVVSENVEAKIKKGQVGGLFGVAGPERVRVAQELAVNHSRLKIPLLIGSDVIHGYKTTFPIPLGLSASWDMQLMEEVARISAREATADGINWNFSPMVDIARDPRWGRIAEGAGEDPYLGSMVARAMVRGYQGNDLSEPNTMMATVKHLALYGAAEAGRDYHSVDMSRIKMFNQYLPPYKAAIDEGVASVMTSFNDIDGVPASGNKWLLTDLLRDQWGFNGMVVSDYTSVNEMIAHGLGDLQAVSALALNAGLDMDMVGEGFLTTLEKSVKEGKVSEESITNAARRILEAKFRLGLFQDPNRYLDESRPAKDILSPEHREAAKEIAKKTFVLLKKQGNTLPLDPSAKIALVGPLADSQNNMLGTWAPTGDVKNAIPVLEGFRKSMPDVSVSYAKGANITDDADLAKKVNVFGPRVQIAAQEPSELLKEAVELAVESDVVVAVLGEATEMSGEAASRTDLSLPLSQKKLLKALVDTGKPVVVVLMSGRSLTIEDESQLPISILQTWHPGVEAGNAIVEVLYGEYNPAGKLTATWPRNVGQIPIYHSAKITGRPGPDSEFQKFKSNYLDAPNTPLYPFGYGLSYTDFEYSDLRLNKSEIGQGESITATVTVKNTGDYDGEEVVQVYLRDLVRTITPPSKQLKGFKKIMIKKGASVDVSITLQAVDLKFYNSQIEFVSEPGDFELYVGGNSEQTLKAGFKLVN
ncbi:beta-glucosidase BglX [Zeaxanthinibacter sp. PT1]|uniref:beta-glucosidase BglX n=1 Tax=Zeaxanthinibacter TaxID=561554 RepID=UPI00234B5075|nr:beta-glucosidase BglX [Zeaxanthinibacter sp. PT1]MDC6350798.1 beta-glucosidase BglX [Zeaxanthinibacter sp. PT1]